MTTNFDYSKLTALISVVSFALTLNYYFGNPAGLPLKVPLAAYGLVSLPVSGTFELPVLVLGIAVISFVVWAYLKRAR